MQINKIIVTYYSVFVKQNRHKHTVHAYFVLLFSGFLAFNYEAALPLNNFVHNFAAGSYVYLPINSPALAK